MSSKTKALLLSVLILPTTVAASTISNMQQNNRQLRVEQIQEETALYEAMLAREKVRHELRTTEQENQLSLCIHRKAVQPSRQIPCPHYRYSPADRDIRSSPQITAEDTTAGRTNC